MGANLKVSQMQDEESQKGERNFSEDGLSSVLP